MCHYHPALPSSDLRNLPYPHSAALRWSHTLVQLINALGNTAREGPSDRRAGLDDRGCTIERMMQEWPRWIQQRRSRCNRPLDAGPAIIVQSWRSGRRFYRAQAG
ncbi:MAG TPA: hypothetical protein DFR83_01935 [Deltaproteobacteria bacterium]|nr:hypothetical protein [Deltaproteobacteria bacterium]